MPRSSLKPHASGSGPRPDSSLRTLPNTSTSIAAPEYPSNDHLHTLEMARENGSILRSRKRPYSSNENSMRESDLLEQNIVAPLLETKNKHLKKAQRHGVTSGSSNTNSQTSLDSNNPSIKSYNLRATRQNRTCISKTKDQKNSKVSKRACKSSHPNINPSDHIPPPSLNSNYTISPPCNSSAPKMFYENNTNHAVGATSLLSKYEQSQKEIVPIRPSFSESSLYNNHSELPPSSSAAVDQSHSKLKRSSSNQSTSCIKTSTGIEGPQRLVSKESTSSNSLSQRADTSFDSDPLLVSQYSEDILMYMTETGKETIPDLDYVNNNMGIDFLARAELVNWVINIHYNLKLVPEILYLTVNYIDRFLSARYVAPGKLDLLGITCLFLASKIEDSTLISLSDFLNISFLSEIYSPKDIFLAEVIVIKALKYRLFYDGPINFVREISKRDGYNYFNRFVAKYFIEISLVDHAFLKYEPNLIAAAAFYFAKKITNGIYSHTDHWQLLDFTEAQLFPCVKSFLKYFIDPDNIYTRNRKYILKNLPIKDVVNQKYSYEDTNYTSLYIQCWIRSLACQVHHPDFHHPTNMFLRAVITVMSSTSRELGNRCTCIRAYRSPFTENDANGVQVCENLNEYQYQQQIIQFKQQHSVPYQQLPPLYYTQVGSENYKRSE
ncbi:hypothetical protein BB560_006795 [Smittium megazygosporum]|uniref:Uncharacterized protein n=1 Tax=Smittium megazygosporum TaxID=133381 RepID=A0A2T9Y1J4_9FUNG|nr:hypothetical protein BB560_006795 [Smittium megazygosporum]